MGARLLAHLVPTTVTDFVPSADGVTQPADCVNRAPLETQMPPPMSTCTPAHPPHPHPRRTDPVVPAWAMLAGALLLRVCPHLHPAQTLLAATVCPPADVQAGLLPLSGVRQLAVVPLGPLRRIAHAFSTLGPLVTRDAHGTPWRESLQPSRARARAAIFAPLPPHTAPHGLADLAWPRMAPPHLRAAAPRRLCLPVLQPLPSVRALTGTLMAPTAAMRAALHAQYCAQALGGVARSHSLAAEVLRLRTRFRVLWRLPVCNALRVPLLRVALNAFPGARVRPWHCPCMERSTTTPMPCQPRVHAFWDCPVASAVRAAMQRALGHEAPELTRAAVWLLRPPPSPQVDARVWTLVGAAAVAAMEHGRAALWAQHARQEQPRTAIVEAASAAAVRFLGQVLHDFCSTCPPLALHDLAPHHPFIAVVDGRLMVRLPA